MYVVYILYGDVESKNLILESWGASTKHPDMIDRFNSWEDYEDCKKYVECPENEIGFIHIHLWNMQKIFMTFMTFICMK